VLRAGAACAAGESGALGTRERCGQLLPCERGGPPVWQGCCRRTGVRGNADDRGKGCEDGVRPEAAVRGGSPDPAQVSKAKVKAARGTKGPLPRGFGAGGRSPVSRLAWPRAGGVELAMPHCAERSPASPGAEGEGMLGGIPPRAGGIPPRAGSIPPRAGGSAEACRHIPRRGAVLRQGRGGFNRRQSRLAVAAEGI